MPVVIPEGFGQITLVMTGGPSDPMTMVFGVDPPDGMSTPDVARLGGDAFSMAIASNPRQHLWTGIVFDRSIAKRNLGGVMETAEHPYGQAGATGGEPIPWNTSYLVQKRTLIGGRRGRGRFYVPGLVESDISDGAFLPPAGIAVLQTAWSNMFDDLVADLIPPVILHDVAAVAPTPVISFLVQARLATQRRRLR